MILTVLSILIASVISSIGTFLLIKTKKRKLDAEASGAEIDNIAKYAQIYADLMDITNSQNVQINEQNIRLNEQSKRIDLLESEMKDANNEIFTLNLIINEALGCEYVANCPVIKRKKLKSKSK